MTNHFDLAVDRLCAGNDVRKTLDMAYQRRPIDPREVAALNDQLRHNMAVSRMHAHLAEVQALYDLRSSVDLLFQALTAEPDPVQQHVGRAPLVVLPERES